MGMTTEPLYSYAMTPRNALLEMCAHLCTNTHGACTVSAPLPPPTAADAALVCCLLVIYTDLLEWNALGGAFGMV